MSDIQIAYFANRAPQMNPQETGYLPAKCRIIENQAADVTLLLMLNDQVTFIRYPFIGENESQNTYLAAQSFNVTLARAGPNRWPIGDTVARHARMVSKLHASLPFIPSLRTASR